MKNIFLVLLTFFLSFMKTPQATIDGHTFSIEIARTPLQQEIGLAKYTSLPSAHGMYFPFSKANYYTFWMKNMHFPIDIIFIRNDKIVTIFPSVPAPVSNQTYLPTYKSTQPADSVLEVNAGLSKKYGFKTEDKVSIKL